MTDFVAYSSRGRVGLFAVGAIIVAAFGLWLTGAFGGLPQFLQSSLWLVAAGWLFVLIFGCSAIGWIMHLFDHHEQLRINASGICSRPWSDQVILWSGIESVTASAMSKDKQIILRLRNPKEYPGCAWFSVFAGANRTLTGGDVPISMMGTDRTFDEAMAALDRFRHVAS